MHVTNRTAASARKPDVQCSFIEQQKCFSAITGKDEEGKENRRAHNPNQNFYLRDKDESMSLAQNI